MSKSKLTPKDFEAAFYMKPEEVVNFFQGKGLKTTYDWHDMLNEAHSKAFTVAKMTEIDLLKDTQKLLTKSLEEGTTYQDFKKDAMKLFEAKGWTGFKEVTNPKTGEKETVELGTPRRLKTIYTNNINSAYAAGKYKEMLEEVDVAPYWMYQCMMDGHERPEHKALHGKVFKADSQFWTAFYPPNGWGCRCWVISLTKHQVEQMGLKVESNNSISYVKEKVGDKETDIPVYKFEKAGKIYNLKPDVGFGTNIGTHAWGIDVQAWNKVQDLSDKIKFDFISKMAENPHRKVAVENLITKTLERENFASRGVETTVNWFNPKIMSALKQENIPLQSPIVVFEDRQVKHSLGVRKVAKQKLTEEQFKGIYDYINEPDEIYIDLKSNAIIYVKFLKNSEIVNNCDCIKIPVIINSNNKRRPINYIGTTGRVNHHETFSDKTHYKKLE